MAKGNTYLEEAYEDLMEMSQDEEKRRAYEARERALRDQLSLQRQAERVYITDKLTIPHGQSDHLPRRFRSLISKRDSRRSKSFL